MSPELIAAVAAALVSIIGAAATFATRRSARQAEELRELREENTRFRRQQRLADQYIGRVLRIVDVRGIPIPDPPEGLFDDFPTIAAPHTAPDDDPADGAATA